MKTKQIKELISLCQECEIPLRNNLIIPFKEMDCYKLDFENQLERGRLLEEVIRKKIAERNLKKTLHGTQGKYFERKKEIYYEVELGYNLFEYAFFNRFENKLEFETKKFSLKQNHYFKASHRCLAKISIDYCFIDLVIDDTIIDIKTDINQKSFSKYIRQLFMQAIMYESFLRTDMRFRIRNFPPLDSEIKMICTPMNNIALYFWRSNHYYKYSITEIATSDMFDRMVEIYSLARGSERTELRSVMKKELFNINSIGSDITFEL